MGFLDNRGLETLWRNIQAYVSSLIYNTVPRTEKGAPEGVATLDDRGKVPVEQLPQSIEDIQEYANRDAFPAVGTSGTIYVDLSTGINYRWGGSVYVAMASSLALGESSSTAYPGDKGKIAYDHAQAKGIQKSSGFYKITTNDQGHITAATSVTKADITNLGIPAQDTTYSAITTAKINEICV